MLRQIRASFYSLKTSLERAGVISLLLISARASGDRRGIKVFSLECHLRRQRGNFPKKLQFYERNWLGMIEYLYGTWLVCLVALLVYVGVNTSAKLSPTTFPCQSDTISPNPCVFFPLTAQDVLQNEIHISPYERFADRYRTERRTEWVKRSA